MEIRVWQSFSCNNSSSYRLVARFADPATAADTAKELTKLFKDHGVQADKALEELWAAEGEYPPPPTKACMDLAAKYGLDWRDFLMWGDDVLHGNEPVVITHDETLLVYHGYCTGFPPEISKYLKARGATKVDNDDYNAPTISALFRLPAAKKGKKLEESLRKVFEQAATTKYLSEWKIHPPWSGKAQFDGYSEKVAFFCDGKTMGFYLPIGPRQIDALKKYLAKQGVENPSIRLCEEGDEKKLKVIASARCDACDAPVSYIDPRTHDIDTEQLACDKCGGMFELATFTKKYDKNVRAAATKQKTVKTKKKTAARKKTKASAKKVKKKAAKKSAKKTRR